MIPKNLVLLIGLLSLPFLHGFSSAASGWIGSPAPSFRVESGEGEELTLDKIKGKVTVIFYENKDVVGANKLLKDELNKLYREQTDASKEILVRLPIVDCSNAVVPFRGLWKRGLSEHSRKEGMTIYCDWDGKMFSDYRMKDGVSNVVILDKNGRIRFFTSRDVTAGEIDDVKRLLIALTRE